MRLTALWLKSYMVSFFDLKQGFLARVCKYLCQKETQSMKTLLALVLIAVLAYIAYLIASSIVLLSVIISTLVLTWVLIDLTVRFLKRVGQ